MNIDLTTSTTSIPISSLYRQYLNGLSDPSTPNPGWLLDAGTQRRWVPKVSSDGQGGRGKVDGRHAPSMTSRNIIIIIIPPLLILVRFD